MLQLVHVVLLVVSGCVLLPPADCFHCNCHPPTPPGLTRLSWIVRKPPMIKITQDSDGCPDYSRLALSPTAKDSFPPRGSCLLSCLDWQTPQWEDKARAGVITWSWLQQPRTWDTSTNIEIVCNTGWFFYLSCPEKYGTGPSQKKKITKYTGPTQDTKMSFFFQHGRLNHLFKNLIQTQFNTPPPTAMQVQASSFSFGVLRQLWFCLWLLNSLIKWFMKFCNNWNCRKIAH